MTQPAQRLKSRPLRTRALPLRTSAPRHLRHPNRCWNCSFSVLASQRLAPRCVKLSMVMRVFKRFESAPFNVPRDVCTFKPEKLQAALHVTRAELHTRSGTGVAQSRAPLPCMQCSTIHCYTARCHTSVRARVDIWLNCADTQRRWTSGTSRTTCICSLTPSTRQQVPSLKR